MPAWVDGCRLVVIGMPRDRRSWPDLMRFGLLTQWYDPEPGPAALPGVLARGLRDRGHDVSVLTGFPNYPTGKLHTGYRQRRNYAEIEDGITVHRAPLFVSHDGNPLRRISNYISFGASAASQAGKFFDGLDAVWVNYSPITVAVPLWIGQCQYHTPAVIEVGDLWPDTVFASGMLPENILTTGVSKFADWWCDRLYSSGEKVVYISPGVGEVLRSRGVAEAKLRYAPKWADENVFDASGNQEKSRSSLGISAEARVLLYAGALGEAQGLQTLIEACDAVDDPNFTCVIAGSGIAEQKLREIAESSDKQNVRFIGRISQEGMTDLVAAANFCYIGLQPHPLSPITMPSKTQAILASGKPILAAAEGDVARLVADNGLGLTADPSNPATIAIAIDRICAMRPREIEALGDRARQFYHHNFSVDLGVSRIESLLTDAASTRKR